MPVLIYIWNISTCLCWERKPYNTPINWDRFQEGYIVILPRTCLCWFIFEILAHACAGKENHSIHQLTETDFKRDILLPCLGLLVLIYIWNISTCLCWERKPFNTPINWDRFQERYIVILPRTCLCWFIFEILAHACAGKENHSIHQLTETDFKRDILLSCLGHA